MSQPALLAALFILMTCIDVPVASGQDELDLSEPFELSLEELSQVSVIMPATLVPTDQRHTPAAVTILTRQDIQDSGARDLDELLEIHVPGYQVMKKNQANMGGIRGIISDRNNKLLMLVNGRNMNIKARDGGALSERHLTLLGDIRRISIVRGPGSVVSGPGAIAGVISIETDNGHSYEGFEAQGRIGAGEEFGNLEVRYGHRFSETLGLFVHAGLDRDRGASNADAPLLFSHAFEAGNGQAVRPAEPVPFSVVNDNNSFDDDPRYKAHLQLTGEHLDIWARYTRGGIRSAARGTDYENLDPATLMDVGSGYQQLTLFAGYDRPVSSSVSIQGSFSYDLADMYVISAQEDLSWREDEYLGRLVTRISPGHGHDLALGVEYAREIFGKDGLLKGGPSKIMGDPISPGTQWSTNMWSFFGEDQWRLGETWLATLGLRLDKHTYTPWMTSPRIALMHLPDDRNTWKLIYNRSVRRSDDADLYRAEFISGTHDQTETIDNLELRYERQSSEAWWWSAAAYTSIMDVVSWDGITETINAIGELDTWGLEAEIQHHSTTLDLSFSHNYTQQLDFTLTRDTAFQNISAAPYGYGNDLANWSDHCTKLVTRYHLASAWTATGSARVYWGLPGGRDLADYNQEQVNAGGLPRYDEGYTRAFGESVFLNLGLEARPGESVTIALHGYNLLGLLDDNLNKVNFFQRTTQYRQIAPSLALTLRIGT